MATTSNVTSSGETLRARPSQPSKPSQSVQTAQYDKRLGRVKNRTRAQVLQQYKAQGRDVRVENNRLIERVTYNKVVEKRDAQGRLTLRQTFTPESGKVRLTKIEKFREGQASRTFIRKYKNGQFRGETVLDAQGKQARSTLGLAPRKPEPGRLPASRQRIADKQRIQKLSQESLALRKEQARGQFLVASARNFAFPNARMTSQPVQGGSTPANANFMTTSGAMINAPAPQPRLDPVKFQAAKTTGTIVSFSPGALVPSSLSKPIFQKALGEKLGGVAQSEFKQREVTRLKAAGIIGAGLATGSANVAAATAIAPSSAAGQTAAFFAISSAEAIALDKTVDTVETIRTPKELRVPIAQARRVQRDTEDATSVEGGLSFLNDNIKLSKEGVLLQINPALKSPRVERAGREAAIQSLQDQGLSEAQISTSLKILERRDRTEATQRAFGDIVFAEGFGEFGGRALVAGKLKGATAKTTTQAVKQIAKTTLPRLGIAGAGEGALSSLSEDLSSDRPIDFSKMGVSAGFGAVSAGTVGTAIPVLDVVGKTATSKVSRGVSRGLSKALRGAVEIAEGGKEIAGDIVIDSSLSATGKLPVFTPSITIGTRTSTSTRTRAPSQTASFTSSSPISSKTQIPSTTSTNAFVKSFALNPSSFVPTAVNKASTSDVISRGDVPSDTPISPKTFLPTLSQTPTTTTTTTTTSVASTTSTPTVTKVNIPIVAGDRFPVFPIIEPSDGGGGSFKLKFPKFTSQKGGFAPSLAGLESGLTQSSAPKFSSGIGVRIPVAGTIKRPSFSKIFSGTGETNAKKKKKSKKKKKKKSKSSK